jgi:hypothetical protein
MPNAFQCYVVSSILSPPSHSLHSRALPTSQTPRPYPPHQPGSAPRDYQAASTYHPLPILLIQSLSDQQRNSLLDNSSLLILVNFVLSWLRRSSTTAASSPELSVLLLKPGDWAGLVVSRWERWEKSHCYVAGSWRLFLWSRHVERCAFLQKLRSWNADLV